MGRKVRRRVLEEEKDEKEGGEGGDRCGEGKKEALEENSDER